MEHPPPRSPPMRHRRRAATSSCRSAAPVDDANMRRSLHIDEFSRAASSGVWYYQVDIAVFAATSDDDDDSCVNSDDADDDEPEREDDALRCSLASAPEPDVQYYSVLRRYNDFLHLHESVGAYMRSLGVRDALPPFPVKELISPSVFGPLWRLSTSRELLQERRAKFEALLQFIEQHDVARRCPAFVAFLGRPPQRQDGGYVSLKEYTAQNWLSSLKQLTRAKEEQRTRHYTMDAEHLAQLCDPNPKHKTTVQAMLGKRRRRARPGSNSSGTSVASSSVPASADPAAAALEEPIPISHGQDATQVGGARPISKKSKSFHHESLGDNGDVAHRIAADRN